MMSGNSNPMYMIDHWPICQGLQTQFFGFRVLVHEQLCFLQENRIRSSWVHLVYATIAEVTTIYVMEYAGLLPKWIHILIILLMYLKSSSMLSFINVNCCSSIRVMTLGSFAYCCSINVKF